MSADRERARGWLEEQLEGLEKLRNASPRDPSFKLWRQNTLTVLQRIWPGEPARSELFRRIAFSPSTTKPAGGVAREWFARGCAETTDYLQSLLVEVDLVGAPESTAEPRPAPYVGGSEQADVPMLELPGSSPGPEGSAPGYAMEDNVLDLGGPRGPARAADRDTPPQGIPRLPDKLRTPGTTPAFEAAADAAPSLPRGYSPLDAVPADRAPQPPAGTGAANVAGPPSIPGVPTAAKPPVAASAPPVAAKPVAPTATPRTPEIAKAPAASAPPVAAKPSGPTATPRTPEIAQAPAASAPPVAAKPPAPPIAAKLPAPPVAAKPPAPPIAAQPPAPPVAAKPPEAPALTPPPARSRRAAPGDKLKNMLGFGDFDSMATAPPPAATSPPPPAPPAPSVAGTPPPAPAEAPPSARRTLSPTPQRRRTDRPSSSRAASPPPSGPTPSRRKTDPAPKAVSNAAAAAAAALRPQAAPASAPIAPPVAASTPPAATPPPAVTAPPAAQSPSDPAPEPFDPAQFTRATEDFLRNSPILGLQGRPVQRTTDVTQYQEPDAIAVATFAAELGRLGVPEAARPELQATLIELAAQMDGGKPEWERLRATLTAALAHPELSRRLFPVLLPWLDRAA